MLKLEQLRSQIKQTDLQIIEALAFRQKLAKQIGQLKAAQKKEIIDLAQEKKLFDLYESLSDQYQIPKLFVKRIFKLIIAYSRRLQQR